MLRFTWCIFMRVSSLCCSKLIFITPCMAVMDWTIDVSFNFVILCSNLNGSAKWVHFIETILSYIWIQMDEYWTSTECNMLCIYILITETHIYTNITLRWHFISMYHNCFEKRIGSRVPSIFNKITYKPIHLIASKRFFFYICRVFAMLFMN